MLRGKDIQEIRYVSPNAGRADTLFKVIITLAGALAMFELNRVSAAVERSEQRQLTEILPRLTKLQEQMGTFHDLCCSELGKIKGDVIFNDDSPKPVK